MVIIFTIIFNTRPICTDSKPSQRDSTFSMGDPRDHPDNANLPHINQPETLIGVTVTFLVCA